MAIYHKGLNLPLFLVLHNEELVNGMLNVQ